MYSFSPASDPEACEFNQGNGRSSDLPHRRRPSRPFFIRTVARLPEMQAFAGRGLQQRALSGIFTRFPIIAGFQNETGEPSPLAKINSKRKYRLKRKKIIHRFMNVIFINLYPQIK